MNRKLVSLIVLLMLVLSTLACLPCGYSAAKRRLSRPQRRPRDPPLGPRLHHL